MKYTLAHARTRRSQFLDLIRWRSTWNAIAVCALALSSGGLSTAAAASLIPNVGLRETYNLGNGFDSTTRLFKKACLTGQANFAGNQEAILQFDRSLTQEEIDALVSAEFEGKVNFVVVSGSAKTKLSTIMKNDKYSEKLVYRSKVRQQSTFLPVPALTALGKLLVDQKDPELSRLNCGDEYVREQVRGGDLFITVNFRFSEESMRAEFVTKVKVKVMGIKKTKTFTKVREDLDRSTFVMIDAFQIGGKPEELDRVLAGIGKRECRLDRIDECNRIVDRLIDYASSPEGFPGQLDDSILSYRTRRYFGSEQEALFPVATPLVDAEAKNALKELGDSLTEMEGKLQESEMLLSRSLKSDERVEVLHLNRTVLPQNMALLKNAMASCFRSPLRCVETKTVALAAMAQVPDDRLRIARTFFHYCEDWQQDNSIFPGMEAILRLAQTDDCLTAENHLKAQDSLALPGAGLLHGYFLRGLTRLTALDFRSNQLANIDFLASLPALEKLDLSNNALSSLTPLRRLNRLKTLKVQNNAIASFEPLKNLTEMKNLIAYNNAFTDLGPLGQLALDRRIVTDDEACEDQRQWALKQKLVANEEIDAYRVPDFVPLAAGPEMEWIACSFSFPYLYHNQETL